MKYGRCTSRVCCLQPGSHEQCQSASRCGLNPGNHTPCGGYTPQALDLEQVRDIKAALMGKTVSEGRVDHSSPATTPHLRLLVVTYQSQVPQLRNQSLLQESLIDGISFWIHGPDQNRGETNLTSWISSVRAIVGPTLPVFTGAYVTYSSIGWTKPAEFYQLLAQSIDLYDQGLVQGFFVFAGSVLQKMNASLWAAWDIPGFLDREYQPYLGSAIVTARDANSGEMIESAVGTVYYRDVTHVTTKRVGKSGFHFGGWAGRKNPISHTVVLQAPGYATLAHPLQIVNGSDETRLDLQMKANMELG